MRSVGWIALLLLFLPATALAHGGAAPSAGSANPWIAGALNGIAVLSALLAVGGIFAQAHLAWPSRLPHVALWTLLILYPIRVVEGVVTTLGLSWSEAVDVGHLHTYLRWTNAGRLDLLALLLLAATVRLRGRARELVAWPLLGVVGLSAHGKFGPDVGTASVLIHLSAAAVWIGGLTALAWGKGVDRTRAVERYTPWAAAAALVTLLSGALNLSAHSVSVRALPGTMYGLVLLLKHLFLLPLLMVAVVNHLRFRRSAAPLPLLLRAESMLAAATVVVAVFLPQVADMETMSDRAPIQVNVAKQNLGITITPGQVGPNRFTVHLAGGVESPIALRFRSLEMNMGEERILALPTSQGHYTVASDVLAMAGPWRLVVETPEGVVVTSFRLEQDLSGNNTRTTSLAHGHAGGPQPWNRLLMAAALAFGITAAVLCTRWSPWRRIRPKHAAVAAGVLFTGGILQYLSYNTAWSKSLVAPPGLVNAKKADAVSVVRGERIYAANCTVCHGWRGFGDGPATARGKLLPADLTSLHLSYHLDGQLYWWVTNGVPRSSMPGFKDSLTDEDRWDVVNYVRTLRHVKEQETLPLVQQAVVALFSGNRDLFAHVAAPAVVAALEAGEIALPGEQRSLLVDMDQVQVREFENEVLDEGLTYRAKIPGTQQPADIYMTLNRFEGKWLVTKFWITPPETNKRSGATSPAPVLPGRT